MMHGPMPGPYTVLVAEEDAVQRSLLREVLQALRPCRVEEAADGPAALTRAQAQRPDLILLDHELPPDGAGAVLARLQAEGALGAVPVLILAYPRPPAAPPDPAALAGMPQLAKPYDLDELEQTILGLLPRRDEC